MDKVCELFPLKKKNSLDESLIATNQHFSLMNELFSQPQKCEEDFINNWQVNNKGWSASCWQSTDMGWSASTGVAV
jgi:hypothetical protein